MAVGYQGSGLPWIWEVEAFKIGLKSHFLDLSCEVQGR